MRTLTDVRTEKQLGGDEWLTAVEWEGSMVQLIAVAAIGGLAYVAYSSFRKHMQAIKQAEREENIQNAVVTELQKDPNTGVYRPKD